MSVNMVAINSSHGSCTPKSYSNDIAAGSNNKMPRLHDAPKAA